MYDKLLLVAVTVSPIHGNLTGPWYNGYLDCIPHLPIDPQYEPVGVGADRARCSKSAYISIKSFLLAPDWTMAFNFMAAIVKWGYYGAVKSKIPVAISFANNTLNPRVSHPVITIETDKFISFVFVAALHHPLNDCDYCFLPINRLKFKFPEKPPGEIWASTALTF